MTTTNMADTDSLDDQVGRMGADVDLRTMDRSTTTARSLRREVLDDDLIDELIRRAGEGGISLTGKDGFLPELVRAVLDELPSQHVHQDGSPAGPLGDGEVAGDGGGLSVLQEALVDVVAEIVLGPGRDLPLEILGERGRHDAAFDSRLGFLLDCLRLVCQRPFVFPVHSILSH